MYNRCYILYYKYICSSFAISLAIYVCIYNIQQVSHRVRGRRWLELCNAHQMATVCSEAIKLWGPQFKQSSPKSTHTQAQTKRHTNTHTKRDTRSSDRRQSAVEMRVVSVELCQKVALKTSVHKAAKREGEHLLCRKGCERGQAATAAVAIKQVALSASA